MNTKGIPLPHLLAGAAVAAAVVLSAFPVPTAAAVQRDPALGRYEIRTIPFDQELRVRSATYTPSGKVLVAYSPAGRNNDRHLDLAVMDDDGTGVRPFFSQEIPVREKDNGIRFMVFPDNQRIFLGDFVVECSPSLDSCDRSQLVPVEYPTEVADGEHIWHRWSEIIVAPDNESIAWTTLLTNYSAAVFTGRLERRTDDYRIANVQIVSTLDPFRPDPEHPGGVLPVPLRNGEVKQFVGGGTAISMVGALTRDTADSVVQHLASGELEQITHTPGYNETTVFSPDEKLGITMSTRFSPATDMAVLGLLPRPYPASLNMGLNMHVYTYSVTGVRSARKGNIGPALIDISASRTQEDYLGLNLHTDDEWVYHSPMSWHPGSTKALWVEGERGASRRAGGGLRIQTVELLDKAPAESVAPRPTSAQISYAEGDLSVISQLAARTNEVGVTVHGRHSGEIRFRRTSAGTIEKRYENFSDDGERVYDGSERMTINPRGNSTYVADVTLTGPEPGRMDLQITFGPLHAELPARLLFSPDAAGRPLTRGYSEYDGELLRVDDLVQ